MLAFPKDANQRRHEREHVVAVSRVRELGCAASGAKLKDVSIGGCCLAGVDLPANGEVWVTIGALAPVRATVIWSKGGEIGCEFYTPLTRADLRRLKQ